MDEERIICAGCGCIIESPYESTEIDGEDYCSDCVERDFTYCDHCGEYKRNAEVFNVDGRCVCESCLNGDTRYYRCANCDEWHDSWRTEYYYTASGDMICEGCREEDYSYCQGCDSLFHHDDMTWDDCEDAYFCDQCYRERKKRAIKEYGYKPAPVFKKSVHDVFFDAMDADELMMGVELEIDKGDDPEECAQEIIDATEDVYCKHDGSLTDGVEIVTHPCSLEYHLNDLGWEEICRIARNYNFVSHDARTCGMHVHVGRYQLGSTREERDVTAAKLVIFAEKHYLELKKFARRKAFQIKEWAKKPDFEYSSCEEVTVRNALLTRYNGRYQAVNLTNSSTVEFRIFNGTLKPNTIKATLELVSNICQFAMDHSVSDMINATWDEVASYKQYGELNEYLMQHKLIGAEATEPDENDRELQIGQKVRVRNIGGGLIGTVARIDGSVLIDFGADYGFTHDACGRLPGKTGFWVYPSDCEIVRPEKEAA